MQNKIILLSPEVVHKIAAGEVVENPASIIKELIENSLDAKATRIEIEIENGGQSLIRIEDDGFGMSPVDALLCLERHATSKIRTSEDLFALSTMGFRGEALAAISAVSQFELKTSDGSQATRVVVDGGKVVSSEPCARNRGTSIFVRSLFFNVPARKKFMKTSGVSQKQIVRTVETLSLSHPEVSFLLRSQKEKLLDLDRGTKRGRIEAVLGPFREELSTPQVWGLLAAPEEAKGQRRDQYFFVNQRAVFSPLIAKAVQVGYGTRLCEGLFPPFVLFLTLPPEEVDVNVHPQKREVRFQKESRVFTLIQEAVQSSLNPTAPSFSEPLAFTPPPFSFAEPLFFNPEPRGAALPITFPDRPLFVLGSYLILEREELTLVDLKRARARLLFEALTEKTKTFQSLIWPLEIQIDEESAIDDLASLGIESRLIGKKTLAIDALPQELSPSEFPDFFAALRQGKKIDQVVCRFTHGSRKKLLLDEAFSLWKQLQGCKETRVDPLGRLISRDLTPADLEQFIDRGAHAPH